MFSNFNSWMYCHLCLYVLQRILVYTTLCKDVCTMYYNVYLYALQCLLVCTSTFTSECTAMFNCMYCNVYLCVLHCVRVYVLQRLFLCTAMFTCMYFHVYLYVLHCFIYLRLNQPVLANERNRKNLKVLLLIILKMCFHDIFQNFSFLWS